ncbi:DVU_1553 family AMP-dependent CoA ligase [Oleidesulfovibrio alaskensis]
MTADRSVLPRQCRGQAGMPHEAPHTAPPCCAGPDRENHHSGKDSTGSDAGSDAEGQRNQAVFTPDGLTARAMGISCAAACNPACSDPELRRLLTASGISAWQTDRLREVLALAAEASPYYRQALQGVDPASISARGGLHRLPLLHADVLRRAPLSLLCTSQDDVARVVTLDTSGTSGRPKRLFFSEEDLNATVEFFSWGMLSVGHPGDTVLAVLPGERPASVGRLLGTALENAGMRSVAGNMGQGAPALARLAHTEKAAVIVGSASHVRHLALAWQQAGYDPGRIHTVLLCWDSVPPAVAGLIRRIFGCRVLVHWGMTETGLGGALGCGHQGLHLREADLLAEVIDPVTGTPLPDGQEGELVITTLRRRTMPLIRYRTGDLARLLAGACPCGSPLRRISPGRGRTGEGITLPDGGSLYPADLDNILLPLAGLHDFEACWQPGAGAPLQITLYPAPAAGTDRTLRQQAEKALADSPLPAALTRHGGTMFHVARTAPQAGFGKRRIRVIPQGTPPLNSGESYHEQLP